MKSRQFEIYRHENSLQVFLQQSSNINSDENSMQIRCRTTELRVADEEPTSMKLCAPGR